MEELRSTEILDKEIEDDARRKAVQILEHADEECKTILDAVEGRVQEMLAEKKKEYDAAFQHFTHNENASLPLEQVRFLSAHKTKSIMTGINAYLTAIPREKRRRIVDSMIEKYTPLFAGKHFTVRETTEPSAFPEITVSEGVIMESDDGSIRARATLDERIAEILDTSGYDLAAALFGKRLPE
ncbi:MAG: hypothetical protein LBS64_05505 [Spirochaetaceae bacterium]|jgi:V/A-type H+-transporting ATPase subunit E|nr:hypothetical protein [Spirochaetaceae bacterium]